MSARRRPATWRWGDPVEPLRATLARGGLLAIPTESSYGLAAAPTSAAGVEAIFRLKRRPAAKPLPVVAADTGQLAALGVDLEDPLLRRAAAAWPGPLTLVVAVARALPASAGGRSLAVRVPGHERLRRLLAALGGPLTATSANRSGEAPVLDPGELAPLLAGEEAWIVDDGPLPGGEPSTLVAIDAGGVALLRRGSYPWRRLLEILPELGSGEPSGGAISAAAAEKPAEGRGGGSADEEGERNA